MKKVLVGLFVAAACGHSWAVYKCAGSSGQVSFQETPCGDAGEKLTLPASRAEMEKRRKEAQGAAEAARMADYMKLLEERDAIANRVVSVGMSANQVIETWGKPQAINTTVRASGRTEQWVYRRGPHRTQYVYLDNGVVRTVQDSR